MKNKPKKLYEVDLYEPIQCYFNRQGYEVYGEVNHCDITAVKNEELIVIELKLSLNVELLIQAAKRQRLTELVYIAIPKPKYNLYSKKWKDVCHLIRRLGMGLILVSFEEGAEVAIKFPPKPFDRKKSMQQSKKKRDKLLKEIKGRHGNYNVGGSTKTKIMTAYKENCIHIACCLQQYGPSTPKVLRQMGTGEKTWTILNKNYYGWFERVQRGVYIINEKCASELTLYPQLVKYYSGMDTDPPK